MGMHPLPADNRRAEPRTALVVAGRLHGDGGAGRDVAVIDLAARGCRVTGAAAMTPGSYVTLTLTGTVIVAGRIAWVDENEAGIDFCQSLRPRALARAHAAG